MLHLRFGIRLSDLIFSFWLLALKVQIIAFAIQLLALSVEIIIFFSFDLSVFTLYCSV